MNPSMQFGNASPLLGGKSPLEQVMAQSGQGQSAMNQITPNSPNFDPNTQPPMPPQGAGSAMPPMGAPQGQPPSPLGNSEAETIINALTTRLKALTKLEQSGGVSAPAGPKMAVPQPQMTPPPPFGNMA